MKRIRALTGSLLVGSLLAGLVPIAPAWATYPGRNGRLVFGMDRNGNVEIHSMRADGSGLRRLTHDASFDACAAVSANGRQIAFCSNRSGAFEIWLMKANGRGERQVTDLGGFMLFPDISPDGTRIAFSGTLPDTTRDDIFVVNADGTGLVQLTTGGGHDSYPAWSPDGTKIAFIGRRSGTGQVWVMNADGSAQTQLTTDAAEKDQLADWSPDGSMIAYEAGGDIFVIGADGSGQVQLTDDPAHDFGPVWSPNGRKIAFLSLRDEPHRNLYVMRSDGSRQRQAGSSGSYFVPGWQPLIDQG